jgi:oligoribonuclease (3'-5' exoribonuclease)
MKALRGRRQGLMNLMDTICAHMHQINGLRVEVRVQEGGGSVGEAFEHGELILKEMVEMTRKGYIAVKLIAAHEYREFLRKELSSAVDLHVFRGMRDCGPEGPELLLATK